MIPRVRPPDTPVESRTYAGFRIQESRHAQSFMDTIKTRESIIKTLTPAKVCSKSVTDHLQSGYRVGGPCKLHSAMVVLLNFYILQG